MIEDAREGSAERAPVGAHGDRDRARRRLQDRAAAAATKLSRVGGAAIEEPDGEEVITLPPDSTWCDRLDEPRR